MARGPWVTQSARRGHDQRTRKRERHPPASDLPHSVGTSQPETIPRIADHVYDGKIVLTYLAQVHNIRMWCYVIGKITENLNLTESNKRKLRPTHMGGDVRKPATPCSNNSHPQTRPGL